MALELHDLLDEDLLVSETEKELRVELELRRDEESPLDELGSVSKKSLGQVKPLLDHDAVLRVPDVKPDGERESLKIDVESDLA